MKPILILLTAFLLGVLIPSGVRAQSNGTITGRVADTLDAPMPGAVVSLTDTSGKVIRNTLTTESGFFSFTGLSDGLYRLRVTSVGYFDTDGLAAEVRNGSTGTLAIRMRRDAKSLEAVKITSRRPVVQQKTDMTVLNVNEALRKEAPNALEILKLAPGVIVSDNDDEVTLSGKNKVLIMLNGKEVRLTGRDLLKLLKSMPASSVAQLQVITNPSSKYETTGNTGILNIRTTRIQPGLVGNLSLSSSQGKNNMGDYSVNLSSGIGRLSTTAYLAYHHGRYETLSEEDRVVRSNPAITELYKESSDVQTWSDPVLRIQADYFLNSRHTFGALLEREKSTNTQNYSNLTFVNPRSGYDSVFYTDNFYPNTRTWVTYNLNYRFADSVGNEFNLDFDNSEFLKEDDRRLTNGLLSERQPFKALPESYLDIFTDLRIQTIKGDYTHNFSKGEYRLEAGVKASFVNTKNNFLASRQHGTTIQPDSNLTNNFDYNERIQAVYTNLSKNWKKWGVQAGVRVERSDIQGRSLDMKGNRIDKPDSVYVNVLPSAFLTFQPTDKHSFRLSMTQQIRRPDYGALRPFNYQLDLFSYYVGNPYLQVQKNTNTELSYTYKNKTTFTAAYNHTENYFNSVNYQVGAILYETVDNAGVAKDLTFALNQPVKLAKWWTTNNKGTLFYNSFKGKILDGVLDAGQWGFSLYSSHRFVVPGNYIVQLTGRYNSSSRLLIYEIGDNASVGLSVGKRLFKDKSILRIGFQDIFLMQRRDVTVKFNSLDYIQRNTWESRRAFIEFSYKFGTSKTARTRNRETGNSEERGRAGK